MAMATVIAIALARGPKKRSPDIHNHGITHPASPISIAKE